jgi:hypothetical protein
MRYLLLLLLAAGTCRAASPCAQTIADLRAMLADDSFALKWRETTMDDGKPLLLSISERGGLLVLQFVKTDEGLWAEGASMVCRNGGDYEVRLAAEQIRLGPAASWTMQAAMSNGGQFTLTRLGAGQLRVATTGWSGTFASAR